jgi:hypothetical protein
MRRKIKIAVVLAALAAVGLLLVILWIWETPPPVQIGMKKQEVLDGMHKWGGQLSDHGDAGHNYLTFEKTERNSQGNAKRVTVYFDADDKVVGKHVQTLPPASTASWTGISWLDQALKAIGW